MRVMAEIKAEISRIFVPKLSFISSGYPVFLTHVVLVLLLRRLFIHCRKVKVNKASFIFSPNRRHRPAPS